MGIPSFYRWLTERCPLAVVNVVEDRTSSVNGVKTPIDCTLPNPNGFEFDNLYLDMNGIIHPCFHPENLPSPKSYDEVFRAMFKYIDRIFSLIRPRKLLFLAIDGVAPRAKLNQQRARRFRAAKSAANEAMKNKDHIAKADGTLVTKGLDSNVITPGTVFMELLSSALHYYVHLKLNNDPGWKRLKVILSDASVPGEGEHKIISHIRLQRNLPGFDPNTRHCLYGLDADLIMLALATHEIHFTILREDVAHAISLARWVARKSKLTHGAGRAFETLLSKQRFQFIHIWILRDYLSERLRISDPTMMHDPERLIDDFVLMCLFVGNDFLPQVPSLDISERALDLLMAVYRREFIQMGGYLTDSFEVNLGRVEHFVKAIASHESAIFKKRFKVYFQVMKARQISWLKCAAHPKAELNVNLGEGGWKGEYYKSKFGAQTIDDRERVQKNAVLKYVEGICWVMHYYYKGVCSWQWFYPHHYAPFASDFQDLDKLGVHFSLGKPFKPFDQLMSVLPAASAEALPLHYRDLMTNPSSPILDFYPVEFELDLNGAKKEWKAVVKLPFIDEARLLAETAKLEHTLMDGERRRNIPGDDKLFFGMSHPLAAKIMAFSGRNKDNPKLHTVKLKTKINPKISGGLNGYIYISDKPICPAEISSHLQETIADNKVLVVIYKTPHFHPHVPKLPLGVTLPTKVISRHNVLRPPSLWHWHPQFTLKSKNGAVPRKKTSKANKQNTGYRYNLRPHDRVTSKQNVLHQPTSWQEKPQLITGYHYNLPPHDLVTSMHNVLHPPTAWQENPQLVTSMQNVLHPPTAWPENPQLITGYHYNLRPHDLVNSKQNVLHPPTSWQEKPQLVLKSDSGKGGKKKRKAETQEAGERPPTVPREERPPTAPREERPPTVPREETVVVQTTFVESNGHEKQKSRKKARRKNRDKGHTEKQNVLLPPTSWQEKLQLVLKSDSGEGGKKKRKAETQIIYVQETGERPPTVPREERPPTVPREKTVVVQTTFAESNGHEKQKIRKRARRKNREKSHTKKQNVLLPPTSWQEKPQLVLKSDSGEGGKNKRKAETQETGERPPTVPRDERPPAVPLEETVVAETTFAESNGHEKQRNRRRGRRKNREKGHTEKQNVLLPPTSWQEKPQLVLISDSGEGGNKKRKAETQEAGERPPTVPREERPLTVPREETVVVQTTVAESNGHEKGKSRKRAPRYNRKKGHTDGHMGDISKDGDKTNEINL